MKKLFLASYAALSLKLIAEMLPKPANQLRAAFIPTAADPYDNKDFVYADRDALVHIGMSVSDIDLKSTRGEALEEALSEVDVILVAGGNTFYLLDQVKKSGFDAIVKRRIEKGVIYIGSSAGSILCCPTIEGARRFDDPAAAPNLTDFTGLKLVDFAIIPHAQKEKYRERIQQTVADLQAKNIKYVILSDDQAIEVNGEEAKVVELPGV